MEKISSLINVFINFFQFSNKIVIQKDIFGEKKSIQIEEDEWWFNGRIILRQRDLRLQQWVSFENNKSPYVKIHDSKKDMLDFAIKNPCRKPKDLAKDYL